MNQKSFDPYRKWLGIPPRDQPANHYRLLGIEVFESDPDVISNAADGRMGQIRTFQTGKHSDWSQRLLNEVAAARVCLLNETKKAAYDETLRQETGPKNAPPVVISAPPSLPGADFGRRHRQRLPILAASIAVALVMLGLAVLLLQSGDGPDNDSPPGVEPNTEVAALQDTPVEDHTPTQPDEIPPTADQLPEDEPSMDDAPDPGVSDLPDANDQGMAGASNQPLPENSTTGQPTPDSPSPEPTTTPVTPSTTPPTTTPTTPPPTQPPTPNPSGLGDLMKPASRALPAESAQEDARQEIRKIFQDDFDSANTPADKVALAAKLRLQGLDTGDDPAVRFVFLKMAADLAATAPDAQEAFKSVDAIKEHYDVNVLEMKADVLTDVVKVIRGETDARLALAAGMLAEEAVDQDDYEMADRLFNLGKMAARKANNKIIGGELTARVREVGRTVRAYSPIEKALAVLADNPLDAKANGVVGEWRCFEKNDWTGGLAYLAKGEDTTLAELAQRDLATIGNLLTPDQQRQLGDDWWDLSVGERGATKAAYMCRAAHWDWKALTGASGLAKAAITKRLDTIARDKDVIKSPAWGAVEDGNVALATNGTTVEGVDIDAHVLLDGNVRVVPNARSKCPCQWVITFAKPYRLKEIRFRFWDIEPRYYRYGIFTSSDGKTFVPLADRSQGNWLSWQQFRFSSRLVKSVKIIGVYGSFKSLFTVGEFEAYCIPPKTPPEITSQ